MRNYNMHHVAPKRFIAWPDTADAKRRLPSLSLRATSPPDRGSRDGASIVLIVIMIFTFLILAGISIDYSYMMLIRKEIKVATDAAAKTGAIALADSHNANHARDRAVYAAGRMTVAGKDLKIKRSDVEVGAIQLQADKSWKFIKNGVPLNAVRVNSKVAGKNAIPLFFGGVTGFKHFEPETHAVAGQTSIAVSICLDRSGSMCFDLTGDLWSYAPNNPLFMQHPYKNLRYSNETSPPHPLLSRWAVLNRAIDVFFESAYTINSHVRIGLVTWGSDFKFNHFDPVIKFPAVRYDYPIRSIQSANFVQDRKNIKSILKWYSDNRMGGATNISAGLKQSLEDLNRPEVGNFSQKVIVLFTDGERNEGDDPDIWAKRAARDAVTIHTITMLVSGQANKDMERVARLTGGKNYKANNEADLKAALKDIASMFETAITD